MGGLDVSDKGQPLESLPQELAEREPQLIPGPSSFSLKKIPVFSVLILAEKGYPHH